MKRANLKSNDCFRYKMMYEKRHVKIITTESYDSYIVSS